MSVLKKCQFCVPAENFNILLNYLPVDYEHVVCGISANNNNTNFKARLRTSGKKQEQAQKWLEDFQMQSKCTMRVERTYPRSGTKNVYKVDLRCQHNTRPRNEKMREKESKNTDCPAKMGITVKRIVTERKSRSKDPHLPDYPTLIQIDFSHNHAILTPEILKHRSVLPEVKEKILTLFKLGHNPNTALDMHKYDLLLEYGENFEKICHDRALLPDSQYCYRLYYKILKKQGFHVNSENSESQPLCSLPQIKSSIPLSNRENSSLHNSPEKNAYGKDSLFLSNDKKKKRKLENTVLTESEIPSQLEEVLYKFCENGGFAGMQITENNTVMALCTPLMHRVHCLVKQSGELVFVDAYGDFDEPSSCRVFLFFTYSCVGPVPIGCIVTTSSSTNCLKAALDLWKQILPKGCFYNKSEGPDIFFTNDNDIERQGLKMAFPKSQLLICTSHILQATWTFLLNRKNTLKKEHRSLFISKIKMLLFSQSVEELEMNYAYTIADNLIKSNAILLDYIKHLYNHRHDWSLVYRQHLLPRGNDFSIYWESALILQKDPILSRSRTYNQLQIVDFLPRLDTYYERKLIDLANNRFDSVRLSRFLFIDVPKEAYVITQNSEIEYEVHNDTQDTVYQVDISLGVCECRTGKAGAPCKHQLLVLRNFPIPLYDCVPPSTPVERNLLLQVATGQEAVSELAAEVVPKTVQPIVSETCNSGMAIHGLDTCGEGDFFLDEGNLSQNISINTTNQALITHINTAILSQSTLTAPANSLVPSNAALDHADSGIGDSILSSTNLLPHLNATQTISLHPELNPGLEHVQSLTLDPPPMQQHPEPPPPPPLCSDDPKADESSLTQIIDKICSDLKHRTSKSPASFRPALGTFLKNLENLSTDSSLEYALYSFGKFAKCTPPLFKRKIVDNKLIGLQSTGKMKKKLLKAQTTNHL